MHSPWVSPLFLLAVWLLQGGVVASDPVDVAHGAGELAPRQPRGAIDRQGRIHLTFGVGQSIVYRRSSDGDRRSRPRRNCPPLG